MTDLQQEKEQTVVADMGRAENGCGSKGLATVVQLSVPGRVCPDFVAQIVAQIVADCAQMRSFDPTDAAVSR